MDGCQAPFYSLSLGYFISFLQSRMTQALLSIHFRGKKTDAQRLSNLPVHAASKWQNQAFDQGS